MNLRVTCVTLLGHLGLGSVAWTEPRLLGTTTGQHARWSEKSGLEAGLLVVERCGLATAQLYSLVLSIGDSGMNRGAFSSLAPTYYLCQPIVAPGNVAIGTAVANSSWCAVSRQSSWHAGTFLDYDMFCDDRGRGPTINRQSMGPCLDTATLATVMSTKLVDSGSFC